jgi:hypothetical protein
MAIKRLLWSAIALAAFLVAPGASHADHSDWPPQRLEPQASPCYPKAAYRLPDIHTFLNRYRYPPIDSYPPPHPDVAIDYKIFRFPCPYVTPAELYSNQGIR